MCSIVIPIIHQVFKFLYLFQENHFFDFIRQLTLRQELMPLTRWQGDNDQENRRQAQPDMPSPFEVGINRHTNLPICLANRKGYL
jgi:hypothetical protein